MGAENPSGSSLILWSDTRRNRDRERRRNKTRIPKSRQSEAALSSAHHWRKREFRLCNTRPRKKLTPEQIKRKKTDTHTHTGIRIRERGDANERGAGRGGKAIRHLRFVLARDVEVRRDRIGRERALQRSKERAVASVHNRSFPVRTGRTIQPRGKSKKGRSEKVCCSASLAHRLLPG
ncbi:hypothetical protein TNCV_766271 [Trichonephila clavipes]|nr:hypothetical protein TNCV_766271 [Trichonephila clavipes]